MDPYIRTLRREELATKHGGQFDEENADRVLSWLVAAENRSPVVLVGAGFTRNARIRGTGEQATSKEVALWPELKEKFASDLGLHPGSYDVPTLFELYEEQLGGAKLRDSLCESVADHLLEPGPAHEALAQYSCEAIVTTNCLDTVLDKACLIGWRRVVVDADLSASNQRRDLIYVHGHRDFSDSWVMTRSQYEDFPRTKPVILARVRQLLAQHPWLIVGFSMGDPSFHAIARLLGNEMRGHQPLSLAIMQKLPSPAEQKHWRRLGFEMAAPAKPNGFGEFLAWLFPKLMTTYSPTSEAAKDYIRRPDSLEERLRRFRKVNSKPIVDRAKTYRAWKQQIENLLTVDERVAAKRNLQLARRDDSDPPLQVSKVSIESAFASRIPSPGPEPLASSLLRELMQQGKFKTFTSEIDIRYLDRLLEKATNLRAELAEHFAWGLQQHLFDDAHPRGLMEVVTIRLANQMGWSSERIQGLVHDAVTCARKYDEGDIETLLNEEVRALGFELPLSTGSPREGHLIAAQKAYRAFMNADFRGAADAYESATKLTSAAGMDLEAWVYTTGQADALSRTTDAVAVSANDSDRERGHALGSQVRQLEKQPVVQHWIRQADERSRKALLESVQDDRSREHFRMTGSSGFRWSDTARALLRTYQELQSLHAPPSVRKQYLEPLVSFLAVDKLSVVLAHAAKPEEWIDDLLARTPRVVAERKTRDAVLIDAFLGCDDETTKSEQIARLKCAKRLKRVVRMSDIPRVFQWLEGAAKQLGGGWQDNARGSGLVDGYWEAFSAVARWERASSAFPFAQKLKSILGDVELENVTRALYDLPWECWKLSTGPEAKGFLDLLTSAMVGSGQEPSCRRATEYGLFALRRMLDAGLAPELVRGRLDQWSEVLNRVELSEATHGEAKRAGFLVEQRLIELNLIASQSLDALIDKWFGSSTRSDKPFSRDEYWTVICENVEKNGALLNGRLQDELNELIKDERTLERYRLNPHFAYAPTRLLVTGLTHLPVNREELGPFLLKLLEVAPRQLEYAHSVVLPDLWGPSTWRQLLNLIIALCGGGSAGRSDEGDPGFKTRCQTAALGLFGNLEGDGFRRSSPTTWHALQGLTLASLSDERSLIANYAAFAVVKQAMRINDGDEASLYALALGRIASDARVEVRSAVADAGIGLAARASHSLVRDAANRALEAVQGDDNAQLTWLLAHARTEEKEPTSGDPANQGAQE